MSKPTWHLDAAQAGLASDLLTAGLDPTVPSEGLRGLRVDDAELPDARLLGFEWLDDAAIAPDALLECVVRGDALLASYGETAGHPVRVDAAWRAAGPSVEAGLLAAVELVLSVHTSLLDSRPALMARSRLVAGEVLRLSDVDAGVFDPVSLSADAPPAVLAAGGPSCLVFRPSGDGPSYAEMVHPADFPVDEIRCPSGPGDLVEVRHGLFARSLEKGVVLRSRIRGVWAAADGDLAAIAAAYRSFAASEPPLGS